MYSLSGIQERKIKMQKIKWLFPIGFIVIGITILCYPKISKELAEKSQVEMIKIYQETIEDTEEEQLAIEYEKAKQYNENISEKLLNRGNNYNEILNLSPNGIMSYLEIPKISAKLPIYHGTADDVMKKGVGHLQNTSLPIGGESTHCALTGHTGLVRAEIFTKLDELEINDYFYLTTLEERLVYQVFQIKVVLPTETQDLEIKKGEDLVTLITCTPYGVNTHRLLVQGKRVQENQEETSLEADVTKENMLNKPKNNSKIWIFYGGIILLVVLSVFIYIAKKYRNRCIKKY